MRISKVLGQVLQVAAFVVGQEVVPYSEYILAPSSRTLTAPTLHWVNGTVKNAAALTTAGGSSGQNSATFVGVNSSVTLDFGKNIAGTVKFQVDSVSATNERIGFTFTESSLWISPSTCDATQDSGLDAPLWFDITGPGVYEADKYHQRGGFRYLSISHVTSGNISISQLTVTWTAAPEMENPQAYTGYFHSDSEKLNRVWYAGAYTNQLCSIDPSTGNSLRVPLENWYLNYTISGGNSVLVDGAKRDRLVWPGDIAISGPSLFVSTNSLAPIRYGIDSLFALQTSAGALPWAGVPFTGPPNPLFSFTYHCHTLNDIYDYYLFTGDLDYVKSYWTNYTLGVNYAAHFIDSTGMANVTSSLDWLRSGMGGHNIEANAILYYTLQNAVKLSKAVGDKTYSCNWRKAARGIKNAIPVLWDASQSLFWDNDIHRTSTSLHPQDGNAWAVVSGIVNASQADAISAALKNRWTPYGAPAPEAGATISPFATGFEVRAHFLAGHAERAVELIEMMWADFMLDNPYMTNSSFIEGYSTTGALHYAPYSNDPRISHAHGWATGPTSTLSFLAAGIQLVAGAGAGWELSPSLGNLNTVSAGYTTSLGKFSASWVNGSTGLSGEFAAPSGTNGTLILPVADNASTLTIKGPTGTQTVDVSNQSKATVGGLQGGQYTITVQ